jgi:hypothetical protein
LPHAILLVTIVINLTFTYGNGSLLSEGRRFYNKILLAGGSLEYYKVSHIDKQFNLVVLLELSAGTQEEERCVMAIPIAPTPVLEGEEAIKFLEKLSREENETEPVWTPSKRLASISQKILERAKRREK